MEFENIYLFEIRWQRYNHVRVSQGFIQTWCLICNKLKILCSELAPRLTTWFPVVLHQMTDFIRYSVISIAFLSLNYDCIGIFESSYLCPCDHLHPGIHLTVQLGLLFQLLLPPAVEKYRVLLCLIHRWSTVKSWRRWCSKPFMGLLPRIIFARN